MPLLITESNSSLQRVAGVALSAGAAARLRIDSNGWSAGTGSYSLVVPCIIDEPLPFVGERVVLEVTSGQRVVFALCCRDDGTGSRIMAWHIAGQEPLLAPAPDASTRVTAVAFTYERHPTDPLASIISLWVAAPTLAVMGRDVRTVGPASLPAAPWALGLGHHRLESSATTANLRGCALVFGLDAALMGGRLAGDGTPTPLGSATADLTGLIFPVGNDGQRLPDLCGAATAFAQATFLAANHSCSGRLWNGSHDCRPGTTTPVCALFDKTAPTFGAFWNRAGGGLVTGVVLHVNPYEHAGLARVPGPVNRTVEEGITAPFTNQGPVGLPDERMARMVRAAAGDARAGQVHVVFAANSRGITSGGPAAIHLSDGLRLTRRLYCTYPEMGLASIAALWNGRLVGMSNLPLPTGLASVPPLESESGHDEPEPLFGMDCEAERPLCWNLATNQTVSVASATLRMSGSSYSRAWFGTRSAPPLGGIAARFQGNGSPRLLRNGFAYRLLVRPEAGLPSNEAIEVGFHVLRHPRASSFWIRSEWAHSQKGPALGAGPQLMVTSDLDRRNVASQRIISYSPPVMENDTTVLGDGWITIMNRAGLIGPSHVGQWLEITDQNLGLRDLVCIRGIDNDNPDECRVFHQGMLRTAPEIPFDVAHWLKVPAPRYRKLTLELAPGEADHWRGVAIGVSGWASGAGLVLLGAHFRNPVRPGIVAGHAARSGAGFSYQYARACTAATPSLGTSPFDEMVQLLAPDVLICCTADQGDSISTVDGARQSVGAYAGAWQRAAAAAGNAMGIILYSTGPEFAGESLGNYREDAKASFHMAYRQAAADLGAVHASLYYDLTNGAGCMNSHLTGENTESRTHPSTAFDVARIFDQVGQLLAAPCAADFNQDGGVDGADVDSFTSAWESGQPQADVNQDGGIDGSDVDRFMTDWEAGGC